MTGPVDWQSVMSAYRPVVASANADCLARNATLANHVATMDAVHDLDAIRAAIGDGLLTYYGMSYGTRIGYAYALTYPDRVRAILMDGSVDPSGSIAGLADGATAPDEAWRVFVRARPAAARQFETALTGLTRQPLRLSPSLRFTRWDLTETALFSTASEQDYDALATFIRFVRLAQRGPLAKRTAALRVLRQSYTPALSGWTVGLGAFVDCVDYPDRPDATLQSSLLQGAIAVAPLNGPSFQSQLGLLCEGLPASPSPLPTIAHDGPAVSMLLLGAMHDAATPYLWTTRMAQAFPAAGVVTYDSTQHVTWNGTSSCVNEVADAFLITLRLPPSDPRCASTRP
jgi:pimeloyl-ACP methyl ester carboxylesterase